MHYLNWFDYTNYVTGTTRLKLKQEQMKRITLPNLDNSTKEIIVKLIDESNSILDSISL